MTLRRATRAGWAMSSGSLVTTDAPVDAISTTAASIGRWYHDAEGHGVLYVTDNTDVGLVWRGRIN